MAAMALAITAGAMLGTVASASSPRGDGRVLVARDADEHAPVQGPDPGSLCHGGMEAAARIEMLPDAVVRKAGREHVEYHAEVEVSRGRRVGVAWSADVVDDQGNVVLTNLSTGHARAAAGQRVTTGAIAASLPDGYYILRTFAAASLEDEPSLLLEADQYVSVQAGKWQEMDEEDWRETSRANIAPLVPIAKGEPL